MKTTKTAAKYSNFTPGTRVRSYDFPNRRDCYIEGRVVGIEDDRYKILVDRVVQEDVVMPESGGLGRIVQPPLNGLQGFFGITEGVLLADQRIGLPEGWDVPKADRPTSEAELQRLQAAIREIASR